MVLPFCQSPRGLQHPKEIQDEEYDSDDEQRMNKVASFGDCGTKSRTEKAEQPQHDQDHDDNPQHEISPFRL